MPDPNILITHLDLSVRTYYCLHRAGLFTVAAIVDKTPEELLAVRNFARKCLDELRQRLIDAGYGDPWPELDSGLGPDESPRIESLGLRGDIEAALVRGRARTLARILGTPADDLLGFLSWEQFDSLRARLIELGHIEPGNIEPGA